VRTVGRATTAGRLKARSAVDRQGGVLVRVAPSRKGGSGRYRDGQFRAFADGRPSGVAINLYRGQEFGCDQSAAQQPPDGGRREAP
jgi:hypothetical protein